MSLRTKNNPMGAGSKYYTLTVQMNPVGTCTLTYDGTSHTTTSVTVKEGTIVSYSIYHSTYGTKTGSVTMNANKTLTATGTYTTTSTDVAWTQPKLSANGTLGGSRFAVAVNPSSSLEAWRAFDNSTSTYCVVQSYENGYYTIYNPTAIKVTKISNRTMSSTGQNPSSWILYGSDSNGSWTTISSGHCSTATSTTWSANTGSTNFYKYHKLYFSKAKSSGRLCNVEIDLTAYTQQISYTYYWDITES